MITINGRIFENVYTGAEWASANPVLEDRVQGFDSTLRAFKIGDGVTAWNGLSYYYGDTLSVLYITIPPGSPYPLTVDSAGLGAFTSGWRGYNQYIRLSETNERTINDMIVDVFYTDSGRMTLDHIDIYGHQDPGNPGETIDTLIITFFK